MSNVLSDIEFVACKMISEPELACCSIFANISYELESWADESGQGLGAEKILEFRPAEKGQSNACPVTD